ncbi:MAG: MacB family efflux pump subunit [Sulfurimonas sp.]|jgi:macrolide transport system ATP-binding/permease protein|nr:MacB family efflux pump subunit [Sulfurimonas sp.]
MSKHFDPNTTPLLSLRGVRKSYGKAELTTEVLHAIDLDIYAGEFVAIIGASGSGKSTLMNILGCLDRASGGSYFFMGEDIGSFDKDALSKLRREAFGFVFQSYNLLHSLSAMENVAMPAIYSGVEKSEREKRATKLLSDLGLEHRLAHYPSELSGGQQQRVSIARALMNGGQIILADEPTGALDTKSGAEVIALLQKLSDEGHTIILITHDPKVAQIADRIIEIEDGKIIKDPEPKKVKEAKKIEILESHNSLMTRLYESTMGAFTSLRMNLYRTILTLLGIVIGVASVIAMLAIGDGAKYAVLERISSMGTNILIVRPGMPNTRGMGDIATLVPEDAYALNTVDNLIAAIPESRKSVTVRYQNNDQTTTLNATSPEYQIVRDWDVARGSFFTNEDEDNIAKVAVIGESVAEALFKQKDPLGEFIIIGNILFQVIGVMEKKGASAFGEDQDDVVFVPFTTGNMYIIGQRHIRNITVALDDLTQMEQTEESIRQLLLQRHGVEDFRIHNMASLLESAAQTQGTLTILLGSIAAISLLVGGIGVMNIMLVSVTERTKEIGVRMATGARRSDILEQFLIESLVVTALGGVLGVIIGLGVSFGAEYLGTPIYYSLLPVVLAFGSAFLTGLLFGYLPAKKAANLDPVQALSSE